MLLFESAEGKAATMTGDGGGKRGRILWPSRENWCGCVWVWKIKRWRLSSLWAEGRRGETFKTFASTYTCPQRLCQHLDSLLPTPVNYSFTFSWMLYYGMPSHYSRQLATVKGQPLRTATRLKVSSHTAGHCHRPWALCTRFKLCVSLPSSHFLTAGFHKTSRSGSRD